MTTPDTKAIRAKAKMWHLPAGIADDILSLCDALDAERRARAVTQANSRETWEALQTMRDAINEHIPMPSLESDLLQGPENSVFCAAVAEAVVNTLAALRIENERLRGALEGMDLEAQRASVEALLKPTLIHLVMKMSDDARAALAEKETDQ